MWEHWAATAERLAAWTWACLANRTDVWGRYGDNGTWTAPAKNRRGKLLLTLADVIRHYRARDRDDVLGLHTTSPENTSRWALVDIDQHGPGGGTPDANLTAAVAWHHKARSRGFRPLLTTSNGTGGYHLRIVFRESVQAARVYAFARWLVSDFGRYGLTAMPETFPKQPLLRPGGCGNWVRLPGRHYKRDFWSTVWTGSRWLTGVEAAKWLWEVTGDNPALIPHEATPKAAAPRTMRFTPVVLGTALDRRIAAYMRRVPNLGEGQGRDDNGYRFAAWLVRDLALADEVARPWLEQWNAGNHPPKVESEITKWLASARLYGQHAYGSGLTAGRGESYAGTLSPLDSDSSGT